MPRAGPRLPLTELQPNHEAAQHIPDAWHVAPTCDDRLQLPCGSDRWQAPKSWGGGWLARFQDSSMLPTQDVLPGGTQKGVTSLPPAQMGSRGREGWLQERTLNWESRARVSNVMWPRGSDFLFLSLISPIWTMGHGVAKRFSGHSPGKTWQPQLRTHVQGHSSAWGQDGVQHGQCPHRLGPNSAKGGGVWGSWSKRSDTQWVLARVSLKQLVACYPLGLALTIHFPFP